MLVLAAVIFLSGCVADANYNRSLQQWIGMSQEALYHSWGMPQNEIYLTPYRKVVTYVETENAPIDGNTQPYQGIIDYEVIETQNFGQNAEDDDYYCKTSFTIENNEIVSFSFNGDDCIAND